MYEQISSNKRRTWILLLGFLVLLWALAYLISEATGQRGLLFFIGLFSLSYALFSYFAGAKMALAINNTKKPSSNIQVRRLLEDICSYIIACQKNRP